MKLLRFLSSGRILFEQMAGRPMTEDRRNQESDVFQISRDDSKSDGLTGCRFFFRPIFSPQRPQKKVILLLLKLDLLESGHGSDNFKLPPRREGAEYDHKI